MIIEATMRKPSRNFGYDYNWDTTNILYEGGGFGYMAVLGMEMQQSSTIINCLSFASQGFCGPTLNHWPTYAAPRQHWQVVRIVLYEGRVWYNFRMKGENTALLYVYNLTYCIKHEITLVPPCNPSVLEYLSVHSYFESPLYHTTSLANIYATLVCSPIRCKWCRI